MKRLQDNNRWRSNALMTADLGFEFQQRKNGEVVILHHGRLASTLRGKPAEKFLLSAATEDAAALQQRMARLTGNYKR